eukprot:5222217-Pleurochrysis_carterae.AAC.1
MHVQPRVRARGRACARPSRRPRGECHRGECHLARGECHLGILQRDDDADGEENVDAAANNDDGTNDGDR